MMEEWERLNATCQTMSKALSHIRWRWRGFFVFVCVDTSRSHKKTKYSQQRLLSHTIRICVGKSPERVHETIFIDRFSL